ncbi:MAG: hypothetical protein ACRD3T_12510 [Terriglobia bacterium]
MAGFFILVLYTTARTMAAGEEDGMTLDQALEIVKDRFGLLNTYVTTEGRMMYVVKAEQELRAIPAVKMPESGIALLAPEVIDLARGTITIEALVMKKNPEIFGAEEPSPCLHEEE